jgi:penicillin-binding protein-related factor A (putative recombinase)
MTQRESKLSRDIQIAIRAKGAWCVKVHGSEYMPAGTPDILGCYQGKFFGFETKLPEKRSNTSIVQERTLQKIRMSGGAAHVVCTVSEALKILSSLSEE